MSRASVLVAHLPKVLASADVSAPVLASALSALTSAAYASGVDEISGDVAPDPAGLAGLLDQVASIAEGLYTDAQAADDPDATVTASATDQCAYADTAGTMDAADANGVPLVIVNDTDACPQCTEVEGDDPNDTALPIHPSCGCLARPDTDSRAREITMTIRHNTTGTTERASFPVTLSVRDGGALDGDGKSLVGIMTPFNTRAEIHDGGPGGHFTERFTDTSFDGILNTAACSPVVFVMHNRAGIPLGHVPGNTTLRKTSAGIEFSVRLDPDASPEHASVLTAVRRGDLAEASLGFTVDESGDRWSVGAGGIEDREILAVSSVPEFSLCPPSMAAYGTTSVMARSIEAMRAEINTRAGKKISAKHQKLLATAQSHLDSATEALATIQHADGNFAPTQTTGDGSKGVGNGGPLGNPDGSRFKRVGTTTNIDDDNVQRRVTLKDLDAEDFAGLRRL